MIIRPLRAGEEPAYAALLQADPFSRLSHTLEFHRFLSATVGGEAVVMVAETEAGRLVGAMPWFRQQVAGLGTLMNSLPWEVRPGGCVGVTDPAVRAQLLARFLDEFRQSDCLGATLILTPDDQAHVEQYRRDLSPRTEELRITQITQLPEEGPNLAKRLEAFLPSKTRNMVRKAHKYGFSELLTDEDWAWDFLYDEHAINIERLGGVIKPRQHYQNMRTHVPPDRRRLSIAMLDGTPVSAMMVLKFNRTIEYTIPVTRQDYRPMQPMSFLIWRAMLDLIAQGFRFWDWGQSQLTQTSLRQFKASWNGMDRRSSILILAKDEFVDALRADRGAIARTFPNYYLYPFREL